MNLKNTTFLGWGISLHPDDRQPYFKRLKDRIEHMARIRRTSHQVEFTANAERIADVLPVRQKYNLMKRPNFGFTKSR